MLSNRLKQLRKEKGLTQTELAKLINIGNKTISDYERNITSPDIETLNVIAGYFNVSTDYLLGKTNQKNPKQQLSESQVQILSGIDNLTDEQAQSVVNYINFLKTQKRWKDEN